ncbi:MAG TPA: TlpA disulfide reductase family protein [Lentibacillus sp.]|uniref:TlpA family protein disulfide reductase n=1 Tax=Lentibacillus sp. TaxID=1925746 RepID=UPI002B4B0537|nr:TlpA disulfide reductase family protein [Lentibacillus sp.]HLR63067.1 TlpA disulfide reductase family protein [Lentibacillus sp.]
MVKRILGIGLLVFMICMTVISLTDTEEQEQANNVNQDEGNQKGAGIVPPGETGIETGNYAPDFEVKTLSGETFKLSDLRGEKVILNFWASWCGPCKKEMPEMQKFHEEYGDQVKVVAVNLTGKDSGIKAVQEYVDKNGYTYPIPLDKNSEIQDAYSVYNIPTTYFIGTDGKVQQPPKFGPMDYDYMVEMMNKLS